MDVSFPETEEHFILGFFFCSPSPTGSAGNCSKDWDLGISLRGDGLAVSELVRRSKRQHIASFYAHGHSLLCIYAYIYYIAVYFIYICISALGKLFSCVIILISYQSLSVDYYNYRQSVRLTDTEYLGFFYFFPKDGTLKAWVPWFECYRCRQRRGNSINHLRLCHPCASPQWRRAVMLPVPALGDAVGRGLGRGGTELPACPQEGLVLALVP